MQTVGLCGVCMFHVHMGFPLLSTDVEIRWIKGPKLSNCVSPVYSVLTVNRRKMTLLTVLTNRVSAIHIVTEVNTVYWDIRDRILIDPTLHDVLLGNQW